MPLLFAIGVATAIAAVFQAPMVTVLVTGLLMSVILFAEQARDAPVATGQLARWAGDALMCSCTGVLMALVAFAAGRLTVFLFRL